MRRRAGDGNGAATPGGVVVARARRAVGAAVWAAAWLVCGSARAQSAGEWGGSEQLWRETCRYCHDNGIARELRGAGLTQESIVSAVRTGPKAMPAFTPSQISDQELEQLAHWVVMQKAPGPPSPDRERVPRHSTRQRTR